MARREFRLSEVEAGAHTWASNGRPTQVRCSLCGLIAEVLEEAHFCIYPAHSGPDCSSASGATSLADAIEPSTVAGDDDTSLSDTSYVMEAEVRSMRLRFTNSSRPAFIVAVLGALERL
jgi:hypothetical protein